MRHNRNRQAQTAAEELTRSFPGEIDGWYMKIWLDTVTKKYDRTLRSMIGLKKAISDVNVELSDDRENMIIGFLGRQIGFLQGPAGNSVNADVLRSTIEKITSGWTPEQLKLFDEQRENVLRQFEELLAERTLKQQEETSKVLTQAQNESQVIKDQNQEFDRRESDLAPQMDSLQQEGNQKISALQSQIEPLQQQASSLAGQLDAAGYDLHLLHLDLAAVNVALDNDPNDFFLRQRQLSLLGQIRNREFEILTLRNELNRASVSIGRLNSQIAGTARDYDLRIGTVRSELNQIQASKRSNIKRLGKLAQAEVSPTKISALDARVYSLTTYDPFPIEMYRELLLE
jgi:hypothetical protein